MLGEYLLDGIEVVVEGAAECGSQGAGAKGPVAVCKEVRGDVELEMLVMEGATPLRIALSVKGV